MSYLSFPILSNQRGSIFFALFMAVGMVGMLGVITMTLLKGPVRAMHEVTKRTIAENSMIASGKLAIISSHHENGDCDNDGVIEPVEWMYAAGRPSPLNGGLLPPNIGASLQDPWGNEYGYCVWDHGAERFHDNCGTTPRRLKGSLTRSNIVLAVVSSGPDRIFQTICNEEGAGEYISAAAGSDDIVLRYTYAEAEMMAGGLWRLKEDDAKTAEIKKNISVQDEHGNEQLSFNASTQKLSLGVHGTGSLPNIKTDFMQPLSSSSIEFLSNIKMAGLWISGDGTDKGLQITAGGDVNMLGNLHVHGTSAVTSTGHDEIGIQALASGLNSIGVKAGGTAKAIEANGLIDMMNNKIVKLATPIADSDAATKKYVDDKLQPVKTVRCESFVFSGCSGGTTVNLAKSNLAECKKACEGADVRCCRAQFATTANNPNVELGSCVGHIGGGTSGTLANLVLGLLFPANVAAYCYEQ